MSEFYIPGGVAGATQIDDSRRMLTGNGFGALAGGPVSTAPG
jgi:hypothetical protein